MYVLVGAKGNSLGSKVFDKLCCEYPFHYFIAQDKVDFDATDSVETHYAFEALPHEKIEGVVSFVGAMRNARLEDENVEGLTELFKINAVSLFNIAQALFPIYKKQGHGRLIHIGSNSAVQGFSGMLSYCASKFATHGMIQVIAKEYAKIGAVANQINPCAFEMGSSDMSNKQLEGFMETQGMSQEEVLRMMVSRVPKQRLATVEDLYRVVRFLLFDATDFITGQAINLSGGMMM